MLTKTKLALATLLSTGLIFGALADVASAKPKSKASHSRQFQSAPVYLPQQPGISETVINNYYGSSDPGAMQEARSDQQGGGRDDLQYADNQGAAPDQDYAADQGYADQDVAMDDGGDFGGDDTA